MEGILKIIQSADKERPATREMLVERLGISDRANRTNISRLRRKGHRIVNNIEKGGYYIGSPEEWDIWVEREARRAMSCFYSKSHVYDNQLEVMG